MNFTIDQNITNSNNTNTIIDNNEVDATTMLIAMVIVLIILICFFGLRKGICYFVYVKVRVFYHLNIICL
jgi:hypothetical protein